MSDNFKDLYNPNGAWISNREANDGKVYLIVSGRADAPAANRQLISSNSEEFKTISKIIKLEGTSSHRDEYLWLAHTANNQARSRNRSLYQLLQTGYSSVPRSDKTPLSNTDNSLQANAARTGVINVLSGAADPTGGARFWDGTDFLAWGLNSPNGTPHNKFEEYSSITIRGQIFVTFLNSQREIYPRSRVRYSGTYYTLPAAVFNDPANWRSPLARVPMANNTFYYRTGSSGRGLVATGTKGHSIFWSVS